GHTAARSAPPSRVRPVGSHAGGVSGCPPALVARPHPRLRSLPCCPADRPSQHTGEDRPPPPPLAGNGRQLRPLAGKGRQLPPPLAGEGWGGGKAGAAVDAPRLRSRPPPQPSPVNGGRSRQAPPRYERDHAPSVNGHRLPDAR